MAKCVLVLAAQAGAGRGGLRSGTERIVYSVKMIGADLAQRQAAGKERAAEKQPQFAYLEMLSPRVVRIALATTAILVGLFTVVGPVGTYVTFTLLQRLVYCGVLAVPCRPRSANLLLHDGCDTVLHALPIADRVYVGGGGGYCDRGGLRDRCGVRPARRGVPRSPIPDLAALYLSAAAAAISASLLFNYVIFQRIPASDTDGSSGGAMPDTGAINRDLEVSPTPQRLPQASNGTPIDHRLTTPRAPFLRRLPADAGRGEIIYLTTKTHYIQVYTTAGRARLLLRFADAVAELGDLGMQVHRSYWVALAQVTDMVRRDNRTVLRLTGDHEVPVSRTYLKAVKAALSN